MRTMNERLLSVAVALASALLVDGALAATAPAGAAPSGTQQTAATPRGDADGIAAVVGNQVITDYELAMRVRDAQAQITHNGQTPPPAQQLRLEVLRQLVDQLALAEYAQDTGISVDDATVTRAIADVARSYQLDPAQLRTRIEAGGLGWNEYRENIRREIEIARLRQRDVASKVSISDREVDDYLRSIAANSRAEVLDLAQIVVDVPSSASPEQIAAARQRIDAAEAQLRQGRDFAAVAAAVSTGAEARRGGELGARPVADWPQLFVDAVHGLQPGQVSAVVRSPAGFHIIKLVGERGADALPATAMQDQVRQIVILARDPKARAAATAELAAVRDAVAEGKVGFEAKAREISQDLDSSRRGGDIGWVLPGSLDPALGAALEHLNPGQVSDPVALGDRVVLLQLVDRREQPLSGDQQRAVARNILRQRKEAKAFDEMVQDVRSRTYVRIPDADS